MRHYRLQLITFSSFLLCIVAANYTTAHVGLVTLPLGLTVTAGTFFAGAALITRDMLQQATGSGTVLIAIAVGAVLSAITASPALAVASGVAFAISELVDWAVFTPLAQRNVISAVIMSSIVAAPVDTVLFLWLAGFPVTLSTVAGQFVIKTLLAVLCAPLVKRETRAAA